MRVPHSCPKSTFLPLLPIPRRSYAAAWSQPGLQRAHPVVQGGWEQLEPIKGLLEVIQAVLLQVGGSGLAPEPGCGRRDGWGPQGWLSELVSLPLCSVGGLGWCWQ